MRGFRIAAAGLLAALLAGGFIYSHFQDIPPRLTAAILPAFLLEALLYLATGFAPARDCLARVGGASGRAALLAATGIAPYCLLCLTTGSWRPASLLPLAALVLVAAFWYRVAPRSLPGDLGFLCLVAAVLLAKPFAALYPGPFGELRVDVLGDLMWRRLSIQVILILRPAGVEGFGFWPRRTEWLAGFRWFLCALGPLAVLAVITGFARFQFAAAEAWKLPLIAAGTFLGMLWVVAWAEEFFFRGFLQPKVGLVVASVLFGLAHLPFRGFPNWRFALLAAVAGLFYGLAYERTRSVRAAMVTHALVNTVWRVLLA